MQLVFEFFQSNLAEEAIAMNEPTRNLVGGAIPLDYSPHGAPRQEPRRNFEEGLRQAVARPKAVQSAFYRRKRTKQDDQFERRKFPGVFD